LEPMGFEPMCIFTMSIPEGPIYKRDKKFYFM